jgi:hypothetical protein
MTGQANGHVEVTNVPSRNPIAQTVSKTEAQHAMPLKAFMKKKSIK